MNIRSKKQATAAKGNQQTMPPPPPPRSHVAQAATRQNDECCTTEAVIESDTSLELSPLQLARRPNAAWETMNAVQQAASDPGDMQQSETEQGDSDRNNVG